MDTGDSLARGRAAGFIPAVSTGRGFSTAGMNPAARRGSHLDERLGVGPLAALLLELPALVDDDLAVVADGDGPALQRPGGGALEVDAGDVEARAVAGALELLLALQPVGRAAQVRAGRAQGVDDAVVADDPGVLVLVAVGDLALLEG